jgi:hypothetical protein
MSDTQALHPDLRRWITMLVVSAVAAAFGLLRFVVGLLEGFFPESIFDLWASYSFMAMIPVAIFILMSRRWFVGQPHRMQCMIFWVCILLPVSGFVAFILLLYTSGGA